MIATDWYVVLTRDAEQRAARLNLIDMRPAQEFDLPHYWPMYHGRRLIVVETIGQ